MSIAVEEPFTGIEPSRVPPAAALDVPRYERSGYNRRLLTGLALAGIAISASADLLYLETVRSPAMAAAIACQEPGQEGVDLASADWDQLAADYSAERGYYISANRLLHDNASELLAAGVARPAELCVDVPGPVVAGFTETNGRQSMRQIAAANGEPVRVLFKRNPGLPAQANEVPTAGSLINVSSTDHPVDTHLFERVSPYPNLASLPHETKAEFKALLLANAAAVAAGKTGKGDLLMLPAEQTDYLKQHGDITPEQLVRRVPEYRHVQQVSEQNPQDSLQLLRMEIVGVPTKYAKLYIAYGRRYGVSPFILAAQGNQESGWQANPGISSTGALGIAQFEPATWEIIKKELGFPAHASPLNPRYAIEAQAAFMRDMFVGAKPYVGRHSQLALGLAAYNTGLGTVANYGGMPPHSKIGNYVSNIMAMAQHMAHVFAPFRPSDKTHPTSTGQAAPEAIGQTAYYSQTDRRWAWDAYNTGHNPNYTVGLNGCQPTQAAIILSTLLDRTITPAAMADYNMLHHYVIPDKHQGGTDGAAAIRGVAAAFGLKTVPFAPELTPAMQKFLHDGGLIAVSGQDKNPATPATRGGHDYVIRGFTKTGKLLIADPASVANSRKAWLPRQIFGPAGFVIGVTK
jgi:hypothetical protein